MDASHSGNIHRLLQHYDREGNPRYPANKAEDAEGREKGKDDAGSPQVTIQVVYRGAHSECAVQNTREPHELFGEGSGSEEVGPGDDESDTEDKDKEDDGVGVEREVVGRAVNASSIELVILRIPIKGKARNRDKPKECCYKLHCVSLRLRLKDIQYCNIPTTQPRRHCI